MFDYVRCEYPLPGLDDPTRIDFQTKDLILYLERYCITADGLLLLQTYTVEDRSDPNAKGAARLFGCATRVPTGWELEDYSGSLVFYGDEHTGELMEIDLATGEDLRHPGPAPEWFAYDAQFEHGHLVSVRRIGEVFCGCV